jgi:hypothetical protein
MLALLPDWRVVWAGVQRAGRRAVRRRGCGAGGSSSWRVLQVLLQQRLLLLLTVGRRLDGAMVGVGVRLISSSEGG